MASFAPHRNVESIALGIGPEPEEIKPLASRAKIIRLSGRVKLGVQRVKKPVPEVPLVLLGDADPKIHDLDLNPTSLLLQDQLAWVGKILALTIMLETGPMG